MHRRISIAIQKRSCSTSAISTAQCQRNPTSMSTTKLNPRARCLLCGNECSQQSNLCSDCSTAVLQSVVQPKPGICARCDKPIAHPNPTLVASANAIGELCGNCQFKFDQVMEQHHNDVGHDELVSALE